MDKQGIHWRTGGKITNCGCEMLPNGRDIEYIVIAKIELKEDHIVNGRNEKNKWVATFAPNPYTKLPMILNATNRKRLDKLFPSCNGMINLLENVPVRIGRERCKDIQDGGETWGLRISKIPAKVPVQGKPPLPLDSPDFAKAKAHLLAGGLLSHIKDRYDISPDVEQKLLAK